MVQCCLQRVWDINISIKDVFVYELACADHSFLMNQGRWGSPKHNLAWRLNLIEQLENFSTIPNYHSTLHWTVCLPAHGLVQDFIKTFIDYLSCHLNITDTCLIFNRYDDNSVKDITRIFWARKDVSRQHQLSLFTPFSAQKVCLTVTKNIVLLINLIRLYLREHLDLLHEMEMHWL